MQVCRFARLIEVNAGEYNVIRFLSEPDPANHPGGIQSVETISPRASIIFVAGDLAYKLKRALWHSTMSSKGNFSGTRVRWIQALMKCER